MAESGKSKKNGLLPKLLNAFGLQTAGGDEAASRSEQTAPDEVKVQFTDQELKALTQERKTGRGGSADRQGMMSGIMDNLMTTSGRVSEQVRLNSQMAGMSPEIIQARRLYVSSILSPNDMQTDRVSVIVDDDNNDVQLTDTQRETVNQILTDFFNDQVDLASKLEEWIGTAMFETGSQPVLTVPHSEINDLSKDTEAATESLMNDESMLQDCIASLESNDEFTEYKNQSVETAVQDARKMVKTLMKNYGASKSPVETTSDVKQMTQNRKNANKKVKNQSEKLLGNDRMAMYLMQEQGEYSEDDRPTVLELPSEAVIPVTLPGAKNSHIGYFILTDQWGNPMEYDPSDVSTNQMAESAAVNKAYKTMSEGAGGLSSMWADMQQHQRWEAMSTVFNIAVSQMLKQHASGGDNTVDLSLGQTNSISNCILYNMLKKKSVKMVFVPEPLMVYYCFGYRPDGTGKSFLEDIQGPLALRVTLMVSRVMAEVENSINKKRVNVDVSQDDTNMENTLQRVKDIFMQSRSLNLNQLDPAAISNDIASRSLSIVPQGITGQEENDLSVESESSQSENAKPDDELMERLSNMTITGIGAPHSAMNELSETEYSRTVATQNLMFANNIRNCQHILEPMNAKFIRNYCHLSHHVRDLIENALSEEKNTDDDSTEAATEAAENDDSEESPSEDEKEGSEDKQKASKGGSQKEDKKSSDKSDDEKNPDTSDQKDQVSAVINSLTVYLAPPNVSASRAQFEEIDEFIGTLETVMEKLFPEELTMGQDDQEDMIAVRQYVTGRVIRNYMANVNTTLFDYIPELEDILKTDELDMSSTILAFKNLRKKIKDIRQATTAEGGEEEGGGGGGMGF